MSRMPCHPRNAPASPSSSSRLAESLHVAHACQARAMAIRARYRPGGRPARRACGRAPKGSPAGPPDARQVDDVWQDLPLEVDELSTRRPHECLMANVARVGPVKAARPRDKRRRWPPPPAGCDRDGRLHPRSGRAQETSWHRHVVPGAMRAPSAEHLEGGRPTTTGGRRGCRRWRSCDDDRAGARSTPRTAVQKRREGRSPAIRVGG